MGENKGTIRASYATGRAGGGSGDDDRVGGLVGINRATGIITASYATGNPDGGTGAGDYVGRLAGQDEDGTITKSYAFGTVAGDEIAGEHGSLPAGVSTSHGLTEANVGMSWNSANRWYCWRLELRQQRESSPRLCRL